MLYMLIYVVASQIVTKVRESSTEPCWHGAKKCLIFKFHFIIYLFYDFGIQNVYQKPQFPHLCSMRIKQQFLAIMTWPQARIALQVWGMTVITSLISL